MKNYVTLSMIAWGLALGGCTHESTSIPQAVAVTPSASSATSQPAKEPNAAYLAKTGVRSDAPEPGSAVDTALQWAQKYSEASERITKLQDENRALTENQDKLKRQITDLQTEAAQLKQQLRDANVMLKDLDEALKKWKGDVLGFRTEIREAQEKQMVALTQILKMMGGEVRPAPATAPVKPEPTTEKGASGETHP